MNSGPNPRHRALIILADGFEEIEAVTPIDILRRADVEVIVAGLDKLSVTGARGVTVQADVLLADFAGRVDAVILPGGMPGAANLAASAVVKSILMETAAKNGLIAAICAAPAVILASMGLLKGRQATCYPGMEEYFPADVRYTGQSVTVDGKIITAAGVGAALKFSLVLAEMLVGKEVAGRVGIDILAE
jgi:4-methyl-5(b-hydroxyethyl)-thiazole monophosphate biosynthesis